MSNCFRNHFIGVKHQALLMLLLLLFWGPGALATFSIDFSSPQTVDEGDGVLSIGIKLRAENNEFGSCRVSGEITIWPESTADSGTDYKIINQGKFQLFLQERIRGEDVLSATRNDPEGKNDASDFTETESSDAVEFRIIQDEISESDETIEFGAKLELIDCRGGTGHRSRTSITITDDDPPGNIQFGKDSYSVNEKEGSITLKLNRVNGNVGTLTASVSTSSGSATDGEDYTGLAKKNIEFKGGVTNQDLIIDITKDHDIEPLEDFTVSLTDSNGGQSSAKVTITDSSNLGKVNFTNSTFIEKEGQSAAIVVTRDQGSDGELTVDLAIGTDGDSATVREDYTIPDSTQFTWDAGEDGAKTINIPLLADKKLEGDEKISLQLLQGEEVLGNALLTIEDTTEPKPGSVRFSTSTFDGTEGEVVDITAIREEGSDGALTVDFGVGLEGDTAVLGEDYNKPDSTQFSWAEGEDGTKSIRIPLRKDELLEGEEKISLQLLQDKKVLGSASLIIKDGTESKPGVVSFISKTFSGEEGGAAEIKVTREQGSDGELSVNLTIGEDGDNAIAGEDYTVPGHTLFTWAAGDNETKMITIPLVKDDEVEGDEQISLRLFQGEEELDRATLTIKDTIVSPGSGAVIDKVEVFGDHQIGKAGSPLRSPFVVKVLDAEENPIKGLNVSWSINPAGGGKLSDGDNTITGDDGQTSNTFTVNIPERVVVTATISQQTTEPRNRNQQARAEGDLTETFIVNGDIVDTEELNQNEVAVATVLDGACSALKDKDSSEAEKDLLTTCEDLKRNADDPALVKEGLNLLAPDEVISQGTAVIEASNLQVMNINSRLIAVRAGATGFVLSGLNIRIEDQTLPGYVINALVKGKAKGGAAGDVPGIAGRWGGFINGNISFGDKDDSDNETGFEFDSQGITIGADYRLSSQAVIGAAMGITRNKSAFNGNAGKMDMDGAHLTAYGTYYQNERFYLDGLIKIGSNNYDTRRRVSRTADPLQQAMGNTDGQEYSLSLSGGYKNNHGALSYGPYGRLSYTQAEIDAYTESASDPTVKGSGSVLSISDQDVDSLTAVVGGQLSYAISKPSGVYLPQARFEWEHQFSDDSRTLSAQFVHDPNSSVFGISTDDPDRDYFNLGLGMTMVIAGGKSGFVFYETRLDQENLTQHWIKGGLRIEFR